MLQDIEMLSIDCAKRHSAHNGSTHTLDCLANGCRCASRIVGMRANEKDGCFLLLLLTEQLDLTQPVFDTTLHGIGEVENNDIDTVAGQEESANTTQRAM
jgi:hypothetical protein